MCSWKNRLTPWKADFEHLNFSFSCGKEVGMLIFGPTLRHGTREEVEAVPKFPS